MLSGKETESILTCMQKQTKDNKINTLEELSN